MVFCLFIFYVLRKLGSTSNEWGIKPILMHSSQLMKPRPRMRFLFGCFVLFQFLGDVSAQTVHQVGVGSAVQVFGERDRAFSPLIYQGQRSFFVVDYTAETETMMLFTALGYGHGSAVSRGGNSLELWTGGAQCQVYYRDRRVRFWQFGWAVHAEFNKRQHGEFVNFGERTDFSITLGPSVRYLLPFRIVNRRFEWDSRVQFMVVGAKVGSDYIASEPRRLKSNDRASVRDVLGAIDPFYLGNDFRIGWESGVFFPVSVGSSLGVRYVADWQQLSVSHDLQRARGDYSLVFRVQL